METTAEPRSASGEQPIGTAHGQHDETIPLAEEQVQVGKERVERPVRVRRFVVERPVEQQVNLRDERVEIERRPAQGTTAGAHAFEERTIEVRESHEVPMVNKTAKVSEEVVVRREGTERTETVRDTVARKRLRWIANSRRRTGRRNIEASKQVAAASHSRPFLGPAARLFNILTSFGPPFGAFRRSSDARRPAGRAARDSE